VNGEHVLEQVRARLAAGQRTWVKRRTLTRWAGLRRATDAALDEIEQTLQAAGFGIAPLPLRSVRPDETVRLSPRPTRPPKGLPFGSERELQDMLKRYWRMIPPLRELDSLRVQRRFRYDDGYVVVDLYGEDGRSSVAIELKVGTGGYGVGGQIGSYICAIEAWEAKRSRRREVRGIVISTVENPTEEREVAEWAKRTGHRVDWYYAAVEVTLRRAEAPDASEATD